jgi:hypothetical protein
MSGEISREQLLGKQIAAPHVVILGAGASLAAFPTGDRNRRQLPLMKNIVDIVGLRDELRSIYPNLHDDFEALYSRLFEDDPDAGIVRTIERRIGDYFGKLQLPIHSTLYDLLLLSLREKDAIFTFNWDPFLFDARRRLEGVAPLPSIYHLHGNVRMGTCLDCGDFGPIVERCSECGQAFSPSRLLFPVAKKNYSDDPFIQHQWSLVRKKLSEAWYVTIFGYSAPKTDQEAMQIFTTAWKANGHQKSIERLEIIDVRDQEELSNQWSGFAHYVHYSIRASFFESALATYPRRTCESLGYMALDGEFVEPIPWPGNLEGLKAYMSELASYERDE